MGSRRERSAHEAARAGRACRLERSSRQALDRAIAFEDLADAAFDPAREQAATARDLVRRTPVALVPEDNLETALRLCEMNEEEHMPVVDNGQDMRVIGEVRYQDLVLAYNRALLAARAAERGER